MGAALFTTSGFGNTFERQTRSIDYPFSYDESHFIVTRYYETSVANFTPIPLNTPDDEFPTAFCVTPPPSVQNVGSNLMRYEVKFSTVPAAIPDYTTESLVFPGLKDLRFPTPARKCTSKVIVNYYLVGAGLTYESVDDLPFFKQTEVFFDTTSLGFILSATFSAGEASSFVLTSTMDIQNPSVSDALAGYQAFMADDAADASSYSVTSQASSFTRYMGNIWKEEHVVTKAL